MINGMTISPQPESILKHQAWTWQFARRAVLTLSILGLVGTNIATLLSSSQTAERAREAQVATAALAKKHDELLRDRDVEIRRRADLEREHRNLKQRHLALDQEHKVLLGKNKAQLEKSAAQSATARAISTRMARRSAANAIRNASSIPAEAIPFVGTAIVLGVTALDLNDACETLKDLNELNTAFDHQPVDQAKVCGMKVPTQDEVLNSIRNNWRATYNEVAKSLDIPSSPQQSPGEIKTRFCSTFSSITGFCR